jgi:hypothetical protein
MPEELQDVSDISHLIIPGDVYVPCDRECKALLEPRLPGETYLAYVHWRYHSVASGCSHGC